jgi:hypothetical protein
MSFKEIKELYIEEAYRVDCLDRDKLEIIAADPKILKSLRKKLIKERRKEYIIRWVILFLTLSFGVFIIHLALKYVF